MPHSHAFNGNKLDDRNNNTGQDFHSFWLCIVWLHIKCLIYSEFSCFFLSKHCTVMLFFAVIYKNIPPFKHLLFSDPKFAWALILQIKQFSFNWGKLIEQNTFSKCEILLEIGNSWLAKWTFIAHCKCRFCSHNCDYIKVSLQSDLYSKKEIKTRNNLSRYLFFTKLFVDKCFLVA